MKFSNNSANVIDPEAIYVSELCNPGSRLDDVDNEDGGSVCTGVGFHHAARERSDTSKPL